MLTQTDKINSIIQEFQEIGIGLNDPITKTVLFSKLDEKLGRQFDRNVGDQLFDRMPQTQNGTSTLNEFIQVFLQAEDILQKKVENSKMQLEDFLRQRHEALSKLDEVRRTEVLNEYKIMEGSMLNISVLEGQFFQINQLANLSTSEISWLLQLSDQQIHTKWVPYSQARWHEIFTFDIITGREQLQLILFSRSISLQEPDQIAEIYIPLSTLSDQIKHEEDYDVYAESQYGRQLIGKIQLNLQWMYSRTAYLNEVIRQWDEQIRQQEEDRSDYQYDLQILYEPFNAFRKQSNQYKPNSYQPVSAYPNNLYQANIQIEQPIQNNSFQSNKNNNYPLQSYQLEKPQQNYQPQQYSHTPVPVKSMVNEWETKIQQQQNSQYPPVQPGFRVEHKPIGLSKYFPGDIKEFYNEKQQHFQHRVSLSIVFCFAVILSFYKNTMIDMIICVIFLNWSLKKELNTKKMLAMTVAILLFVLQEIIWLYNYSSNWWNNDDPKTDFRVESGIKIFTVIFSYFQLIIKIITFYFFCLSSYQDYQSSSSNKQPNYDQNQQQGLYYQGPQI